MASKNVKQSKKDSVPPNAVAADELSMATLTSLLNCHKAELASEFKISFSALEAMCAELTAVSEKLKAKTADLEARRRCNNVRIIGLSELIEEPTTNQFFSALLFQLLGEEILLTPPALDQAHRSLAPKPKDGERPRPVIAWFHDYQTKEKVLREACKRRSDLQYLGKPVAIFEEFSPKVMAQRAAYREVMALLYQCGLKPSLRYPAKLYITMSNGKKILLSSVVKAKEYHSSGNT